MSRHEEDEPANTSARMMQTPSFNLCILANMGFSTTIDIDSFKQGLQLTLLNHPRFSSVLILVDKKSGKFSWKRTSVDIDHHVFAPDVDPDMESPDEFIEDFMSEVSKTPMDMTKPLWEFHILNVKTSEAISTIVCKFHHSIGDGVSIVSLLLACSRTTSDPQSLPSFPFDTKHKRINARDNDNNNKNNVGITTMITRLSTKVWTTFLMIFNSLVGFILMLATIWFLKDTKTPIKGERGIENSTKRFVHRIISLDDIKLVKTAMNASINDVALGVVEAGLSRYLNTRYDQQENVGLVKKVNLLSKNLRVRAAVVFNLRPSPTIEDLNRIMEKGEKLNGMWGNVIGKVLLPLTIALQDDPLSYVRRAKATMDRKKLSLEPMLSSIMLVLLVKIFGAKAAADVLCAALWNSTLGFSNVVGPKEEITLFGHPVCYIAPSVTGYPQALIIHCQSYDNKFIISVGADENLIPNPHKLCDDMVKSLEHMKDTVIKKGLV